MSDKIPADVEYPHCRCEVCTDHRIRIRREVGRIRNENAKRQQRWFATLRRFVNDLSMSDEKREAGR